MKTLTEAITLLRRFRGDLRAEASEEVSLYSPKELYYRIDDILRLIERAENELTREQHRRA